MRAAGLNRRGCAEGWMSGLVAVIGVIGVIDDENSFYRQYLTSSPSLNLGVANFKPTATLSHNKNPPFQVSVVSEHKTCDDDVLVQVYGKSEREQKSCS